MVTLLEIYCEVLWQFENWSALAKSAVASFDARVADDSAFLNNPIKQVSDLADEGGCSL